MSCGMPCGMRHAVPFSSSSKKVRYGTVGCPDVPIVDFRCATHLRDRKYLNFNVEVRECL